MKSDLIFENNDLIAFSKPSGLLSIPDRYNAALPCLLHEAQRKYGKLFVVHRLDKDTSGLICFAKNEHSHRYLSQLFQDRKVVKSYLAIVQGVPLKPSFSIKAPIDAHPVQKGRMCIAKKGKPAHTDYETIEVWKNFALLKIQIHTGRTHQIRVHLQHIGHPVVGDAFYGSGESLFLSSFKKKFKLSEKEETERPLISRLALHSASLQFTAEDGTEMNLEAPLPRDMSAVLKQFSKWNHI
jgi:23S rRNA pseudouridine955/2504/2580 synthase/23S rRNA pseudouridine1911/1915/1917 synthase